MKKFSISVVALLWLAAIAYGGMVLAQVGGNTVTHADFTCPTQTGGAWATASYQILSTSTPVGANSYVPNRQCVLVQNHGVNNAWIGDIGVITSTQGILVPPPPGASGSPVPLPIVWCPGGGALYCAGGSKLSVTEQTLQ